MYKLKKSLGQHFLHDENIIRKIIAALQSCPLARLLEVGPGGGALTRHLLKLDTDFLAVEIDGEKVEYLKRSLPEINGRILHLNFLDMEKPFSAPFSLVGNFPYNISTEILFRVLEWKEDVECVIGMFQKEVALRVAAGEGSRVYGVTSVLVQAFFDVEYLFDVHENSFVPPPRVKSGVIRLLPRKKVLDMAGKQKLFTLVKTAFNQRRKTLRNACRSLFAPEVLADQIFDKRAEQLTVEQFASLTYQMK